ncbi:MAG: endonuclease/exonuclease/phosphatase family protein, partial [Bacteroidia bacterium]|nr:endonuclease/exonuclease/phosphatase family protein [Bacteroidia bacterium]
MILRFIVKTLFLCFSFVHGTAQVHLCSWNLENFGKSKSDSEIVFISHTLKDFDLVAVTEVVAGKGGAQAVARLADELNRTGSKWDYCVSDPTTGTPGSSERYAFLWKTHVISKHGDAFLEKHYTDSIEREPYFGRFLYEGKPITIAVFHAVPKNKQPEKEIKFLKFLPELYPKETLIFCGDFNCPQSHSVFGPLKQKNYLPALQKQKTTLKNECKQDQCLASEFDNVFYPAAKVKLLAKDIVPFYLKFSTLKEARKISDHL